MVTLPTNLFQLGHDYTLQRNDRKWNDSDDPNIPPKKGGGICMYIKNGLQYTEIHFSQYNTSSKDLESPWEAIYQKPNKIILIGNLYRPPQGDSNKCINILDNILSELDLQKNGWLPSPDYVDIWST